jgi:hypothetical protein
MDKTARMAQAPEPTAAGEVVLNPQEARVAQEAEVVVLAFRAHRKTAAKVVAAPRYQAQVVEADTLVAVVEEVTPAQAVRTSPEVVEEVLPSLLQR